jgi:Protein of unknown function (DUF3046)
VSGPGAIIGRVRLTVFWDQLTERLGPAYADSFARDHVMSELGGRTVLQALAEGVSARDVWEAVTLVLADRL